MIFNSLHIDEINNEVIEQYYQKILNDPLYFEKNDINELNHNGSSLLFYCVTWQNVPFLQFLLNKGCDINIINKHGHSPLSLADKEIFEIIANSKNLNKAKILPSLIASPESSCFTDSIFPLFLEIFKQEIIDLPITQLQHINKAVFTLKDPFISQWDNFCKSYNLNNCNSVIDVFQQHMLYFSNKSPLYIPNINLHHSIDKQEAIDIYKSLYHEIKNKFNNFVVDLTEVCKHKSQQFTDGFLVSSSIKRQMAQFLKPNEVSTMNISSQDVECDIYKKEVLELYELTKSIINGKSNKEGIPHYLLSDKYIQALNNDWEKIHLETSLNIKPIQQVLSQYNLKCITFDKEHNIDTVSSVLNIGFSKIVEVLKIDPAKIGQGQLHIDCSTSETNDNVMGSFSAEKNSLWLNTNEIYLTNHIKDISQSKLNDFTSIFFHEYTHFLQYLNEQDPQIIFEKYLKDEWENIVKTINYKTYSKNDLNNIVVKLSKDIMVNEGININDEKIDNLKMYCVQYFDENFKSQNSSLLKKMKSIMIRDTTKENSQFDFFKKMIELLRTAYKQPNAFQEELWKNYDKIFNGKYDTHKKTYWSNPIEIHARLNQEVLLNDRSNILDIGHFLAEDEKTNLIQELTPKLEKFNQLLISHKEYYIKELNEQNQTKKTIYKIF